MAASLPLLAACGVWLAAAVEPSPAGFLWLGQGPRAPPTWLQALTLRQDTWVLYLLFAECAQESGAVRGRGGHSAASPRMRLMCRRGVTFTAGRNALYEGALEWERQRGLAFEYLIFSDDLGEFEFRPDCSPAACGDVGLLPLPNETALGYFYRLLEVDQPALASPVQEMEPWCIKEAQMRKCSSLIDAKVNAFHWSAHSQLLPYEEAFERISLWAALFVVTERLEAGFVGYAVQYQMFRRTAEGSSFPQPRPEYIRSPRPYLPARLPGGGYGDSQVVAWLRPQLTPCASARLGASAYLQAGCSSPEVTPFDECRLGVERDYRKLDCLPKDHPGSTPTGQPSYAGSLQRRQPRLSGIEVVEKQYAYFGLTDLPSPPLNPGQNLLMDLCEAGRSKFEALVDFVGTSAEARAAVGRLWASRQGCDVCDVILMAAVLFAVSSLALPAAAHLPSRTEAYWSCLPWLLQGFSFMEMLGAGWTVVFDALLFLQLGRRIGEQEDWSSLSARAATVQQLPSRAAGPWCRPDKALLHLVEAANDTRWRQGHIWVAQQHLFRCDPGMVFAPPSDGREATAGGLILQLLMLLGRLGVDTKVPPAQP
eukprot:TRINITY_DN70160_c0_g1_i1.p1 TRINITY_DN70160_c0_g1~~TRINITY_DN70160_c0_g1_i1.p1  ORF type:complete len:595 (-),score=103.64 TRINITY_DN70160_c0_g1_i1:86-1870(-)